MSDSGQASGRPHRLLVGAPALVVLTIVAAPLLGRFMSPLPSLLSLAVLYWLGCWILVSLGAPRRQLRALYRTPPNRRPLELFLTWSPPAVTFGLVFLAAAPRLPATWLAAAVAVALVNGTTEEVLWRGAFVAAFPDRIGLAYLYPAALFAVWHVALALLPGVRYLHGPAGLLGGAAVAGLAWGLVALRTRDMRSVTIAHILTNVFAFTGLALLNRASTS